MGLYPPLETGENHRLRHAAEVKSRLEKERDFRASLYKKYRSGANVVDGLDTALSVASVGLAASGVGLLSIIIAVPVAIGIQAGAIVCGLLGAGEKHRPEASKKGKKAWCVLAESKINTIADRISTALTDDKITDEEFRLILSEVDKFSQMKNAVRGRQKQGLSEGGKKGAITACERRSDDDSPYQTVGRSQPSWRQWHLTIHISCSRA